MMGFFFMTVFMAALAGAYHTLVATSIGGFLALYALTFFFANWGPNATTFIIPSELFPSYFRATGHGISAASGKLGSIIGTFGFAAAVTSIGVQSSLGIMAGINFLGLLFTFMVPETMNRTLEELSGDEPAGDVDQITDAGQMRDRDIEMARGRPRTRDLRVIGTGAQSADGRRPEVGRGTAGDGVRAWNRARVSARDVVRGQS